MAFNLGSFKTRAITGLVFAVIMLAGLLFNQWSFFILFSIIHFGCWLEYQRLIGLIDPDYSEISPFHKYGVMIAGWCFMLYFTNDELSIFGIRLHALGWWIGLLFAFILPLVELLFAGIIKLKNIGYSALGILYISLCWGLMIDLSVYKNSFGILHIPLIPLVIIACIWINDTMAYIVGSLIGKTPFSRISPKKTWEGTIGGIILCVLSVTLSSKYIPVMKDIAQVNWLMISLIAAIAGTGGDLIESKLKRMAGIKDSGTLMPGHGGFLDRFDSLLLAIPLVWLYVSFILE